MRTTVLVFHPDYARSHANRALADAIGTSQDVEIVEMGGLYLKGDIDVDVEVARLLTVDRLVLQFPVQWYSTPPLLKAWQDTVLTRMYYMRAAEEGERLRGLPVMIAATAGNDPSAYTAEGINLFPLEELLTPLRATANRCFWRWEEPFLIYRANKASADELALAGRHYAKRLMDWEVNLAL
jgi:putative NADPH-quinone reductase